MQQLDVSLFRFVHSNVNVHPEWGGTIVRTILSSQPHWFHMETHSIGVEVEMQIFQNKTKLNSEFN
jgi:hypothetical protein